MKTVVRFAAVAAIASLSAFVANAQQSPAPADKKPVAYRFALASADSDLAHIQKDIEDRRLPTRGFLAAAHGAPCPRPSAATFSDVSTASNLHCVTADGVTAYVDLYPIAPRSAFANGGASRDVLGWVPVEAVENGSAEIAGLRAFADNRTLFDCTADDCIIVVHTYRASDPVPPASASDTLSVCHVTRAGAAIGAPRRCADIAVSRGADAFVKAVVARSALPNPPPPPLPRPAPSRTPPPPASLAGPRPSDLLGSDADVALIVREGSVSDTDVQQTTCDSLAAKSIICGRQPNTAVADVASRFFTARPPWFETFNVSILYNGQKYGSDDSYSVGLNVTDLLVSLRTQDGFAPPPGQLASLYRKNIVMLEKKALFGLCKRYNIVLGSDDDPRPTVFECYR